MKKSVILTILAILTLTLAALPARADATRIVNKGTTAQSTRTLSSNPVASGAQGMGRGWVEGFCGQDQCVNNRHVMRRRVNQMRPYVRVKDGSSPSPSRAYIAR